MSEKFEPDVIEMSLEDLDASDQMVLAGEYIEGEELSGKNMVKNAAVLAAFSKVTKGFKCDFLASQVEAVLGYPERTLPGKPSKSTAAEKFAEQLVRKENLSPGELRSLSDLDAAIRKGTWKEEGNYKFLENGYADKRLETEVLDLLMDRGPFVPDVLEQSDDWAEFINWSEGISEVSVDEAKIRQALELSLEIRLDDIEDPEEKKETARILYQYACETNGFDKKSVAEAVARALDLPLEAMPVNLEFISDPQPLLDFAHTFLSDNEIFTPGKQAAIRDLARALKKLGVSKEDYYLIELLEDLGRSKEEDRKELARLIYDENPDVSKILKLSKMMERKGGFESRKFQARVEAALENSISDQFVA